MPDVVAQSYRERPPRPRLARHVSCLWVQRVAPGGHAYRHRTVPNGGVEIACDLGTGVVRVIGPRRAAAVERLAPGTTVIGARLRAGVAPALLGPSMSGFTDLEVELGALWGGAGTRLGGRLAEAGSPAAAALLLEEELAARSATGPGLDSVVIDAARRLRPWSAEAVRDTAAGLYISPRQLRRRCLAAFGYGPKALQRILRFQAFLALAQRGDGHAELAGLAATAGYADQAHLTRECARLTGLTPAVLLAETRQSCGPTHDHAASFAPILRALRATSASFNNPLGVRP